MIIIVLLHIQIRFAKGTTINILDILVGTYIKTFFGSSPIFLRKKFKKNLPIITLSMFSKWADIWHKYGVHSPTEKLV